MCGLVGTYGNLFERDMKFFKQGLIVDHLRGVHSVGVASVKRTGVETKKLALNPIDFLDLGSVKSMITTQALALIGHNRQATQGAVNNNNAHPFTHGDITLAHNGTLTNKWQLQRDFSAPTFDTDSELICWLIDQYELSSVIPALEGAFALTWWDERNQSINIIHNGERPFHLTGVGNNIYWASEKHMLAWLLSRNNISTKETHIYQPKVGLHLEFKYEANKMELVTKEYTLAKKKHSRGTHKGGTASTKPPSNVSALPPTKTENFKKFSQETGVQLSEDDEVYAYVDSVDKGKYGAGLNRADVVLTLAGDPYSDIDVYYVKYDKRFSCPTTIGVKVKLTNIKKVANNWVFTASNDPNNISFVAHDDIKAVEEMDLWEQEHAPNFNVSQSKEDSPQDIVEDFRGFDNKLISYDRFETAVNKGCCVCNQVLDPVSEALDRTCVFVADGDVICEDCATDDQVIQHYGFQVGN